MEESKISQEVLDSLSKALYGSAFDNYDTTHPFLSRKVDPNKEESPTLSDKIIAGDDTRDDWVKGKDCKNQRAARKDALEKLRAEFRERLDRKKAERKPAMFICSTPDGGSGSWYEFIAGLSFDGKRRKEMMEKEHGVTISPDHWALFEDVSADADIRMTSWTLPMSTDYTIHGFNIMPGPVTDTATLKESHAARDHNKKPELTCEDCANQDESQAPTGTGGVTFCRAQGVNVPLSAPACGNFIQIPDKSEVVTECEGDTPQTLQEKTKTIAETISDLYSQIASLESQKEALKSANEELLELSKNCPECEEYCEIADAVEEENMILRDHNASLVKSKERMLSEIEAHCKIADSESEVITNLQRRLRAEAKENELLKAANEELKELVLNCPACDSHVQEIDALIDENNKLCDTLLEQDVKLRRELLAEKSWRVRMNGKLENRDSLITNLQKKVDEQSKEIEAHCKIADSESEVIADLQRRLHAEMKENEILKGSLRSAGVNL